MQNKSSGSFLLLLTVVGIGLLLLPITATWAAQVTLQWDANDPAPDGYRLFRCEGDGTYDFSSPVWDGDTTSYTVTGLAEGATYRFVVRAYQTDLESGNSNEVTYTVPAAPIDEGGNDADNHPPATSPGNEGGDDATNDNGDEQSDDPSEEKDSVDPPPTSDAEDDAEEETGGEGGNDADNHPPATPPGNEGGDDATNDNGDEMTENPSEEGGQADDPPPAENTGDDAADGSGEDDDNDADDDHPPASSTVNLPPDQPTLVPVTVDGDGLTELTPVLAVGAYLDADNDAHVATEYQISLMDDPDHAEFSMYVVFQRSLSRSLSWLQVPESVLDPDSIYYWRARFIDSRGAISAWSEWSAFTTIDSATAGVTDEGIPYDQVIEQWTVIDDPAVLDEIHTARLQGVDTPDPFNPQVAVQILGDNGTLSGMRSLTEGELPLTDNCPEHLTGVVSFRIHLDEVGDTALVKVHFSQAAPADARWYKFDPDQGWTVYPYATFSADRRSVVLELEDGGTGDMDGVANGVIIDPSGLGYSTRAIDGTGGDSAAAAGGGGGCFIASVQEGDHYSGVGLHGATRVAGLIALLSGILLWRRQ
ncbi:choice-of-anchor U domain-containing protein [Desulfatitalea alkaliphila]|uniref:Fibronectin type III domain-containing protein n=1 Tax=Desulfatitalea alkaliphila TaxID=2929485 RepID=A0AA41UIG6_9BACT|nr:choice-of-anchor U domain-containing protein [Desulfatitalea alkaliphila]MCJ8500760.1 fibronectin type III domain-containing protein [Desulfatitalea alkaliphila]